MMAISRDRKNEVIILNRMLQVVINVFFLQITITEGI